MQRPGKNIFTRFLPFFQYKDILKIAQIVILLIMFFFLSDKAYTEINKISCSQHLKKIVCFYPFRKMSKTVFISKN